MFILQAERLTMSDDCLMDDNDISLFFEQEKQIKAAHLETILILTKAAEYKDNETGDHIRRVGLLASRLAMELDLDLSYCEAIQYASPMHDIGKIGIPERILLKKDILFLEEYEIIKQHTLIGYEMLKEGTSTVFELAKEIALSHHEHWDGSGYPHELEGQQIPLYQPGLYLLLTTTTHSEAVGPTEKDCLMARLYILSPLVTAEPCHLILIPWLLKPF